MIGATVVLCSVLVVTPARGEASAPSPSPSSAAYTSWIEDRYTETWSWVLKDATIASGSMLWNVSVEVQVRDHSKPVASPTARMTVTSPAKPGYISCPDVAMIVDGVALQNLSSQWSYLRDGGIGSAAAGSAGGSAPVGVAKAQNSVVISLPLETFRRIAGAKTVEARLCTDELKVDASVLSTLRAFAAKVSVAPPSAAERQRYREEQTARDERGPSSTTGTDVGPGLRR